MPPRTASALLLAGGLSLAAAQGVPPLTFYPLGVTSGWNACYLNYTAGSDIIPNPSWGVGGPPSSSPAPNFTYATPSSRPDGNHFLDFSSVLLKNEHGVVNRVPVPPGACLPGNLLMVRTSAASYPTITTPATPSMDPTSLIYTTTADDITNGDLTVFQPRTNNRKVTVYFALNYGLRNALDNPYDSTGSNPKYTYGGYYVSNLTTALLGDPSKGLGRAVTAEVKLCFAPMSTVDRKWRKKSGDAVKNKQCLTEMARVSPPNAVTGLAVSDVPLPGYLNASGLPAPSPVAFCRPTNNASTINGVNALGSSANKSDCVKSGQSWSVVKANNYNLSDPAWYTVDFEFDDSTPKAVYFVRVFAKDAAGNYLGFGSSATSANLTNNNVQNFFKVEGFDALHSYGTRGAHSFDIQAGAIGCSLMTVSLGTAYFVVEHIKQKRAARLDTTVVPDEKPVDVPPAPVVAAQ